MKLKVIRTDAEQPWHARIDGDNGEPVWSTENYSHRASAVTALALAGEAFGPRGKWSVEGPPGNAMLVFRAPTFTLNNALGVNQPATAESRYIIYDIDERTQK